MRMLLFLAAGFLAFFSQTQMDGLSEAYSGGIADPLTRFVGTAQEAFGDTFFLRADAYLHGGVAHEEHLDESAEDVRREGLLSEGEAPAPADWIARINRQVQAHEVIHLAQKDRKEMLPFFGMALRLDPHNVEAVLTTAYWLDREFGRADEAVKVLEKGVRDNPGFWEIEAALGRAYLKQNKNDLARHYLQNALQSPKGAPMDNFQRVDIYYHLASAYSALGKNEDAVEAYRESTRFFDEKTAPFLQGAIQDRIKELSPAA